MVRRNKNHISLKKALVWILLSTALISGSVGLGVLYYFHLREVQLNDERYTITSIEQVGSDRELLSNFYLSELIGLSVDQPTNLIGFNLGQAKQRLLDSPVIRDVKIWKKRPNILAIDYSLVEPLFRLADATNTAVGKDGSLFPIEPFFELSSLPEVYCGKRQLSWGDQMDSIQLKIAREIVEMMHDWEVPVQLIDVSKVEASSFGERQIVVVYCEIGESDPCILRLSVAESQNQMNRFAKLRTSLGTLSGVVIDMRIPDLAFLEEL